MEGLFAEEAPKEKSQTGRNPPEAEAGVAAETSPAEKKGGEGEASENTVVRFLLAVPKFVGTELEDYGPYEEEEIANLPNNIAKVLIERGRAEKIE